MHDKMKKQLAAFKKEAHELLDEFVSALTALEENPDNEDLIDRVFRAVHTIKGSGGMFGFNEVAGFTQEIETVYDLARKGKISVTKKLIEISLAAKNLILEMLHNSNPDNPIVIKKIGSVIDEFKALTPSPGPDKTANSNNPPEDTETSVQTYLIRFRPIMDIFSNGTNPVPLINELSRLGECHIIAHTEEIPLLPDIKPELCYVFWDIILISGKGRAAIEDIFTFVADTCQISILPLDDCKDVNKKQACKEFINILVERGDLTPENIPHMFDPAKSIGELLNTQPQSFRRRE